MAGQMKAMPHLPPGVGDKLRPETGEELPPAAVAPAEYGFSGVASAKDPLVAFLNKGISESPEQLSERYGNLFDSGNFGFRGPSNLGMDSATTGALRGRLSSKLQGTLGNARGTLLRQSPYDFAKRQGVYQGLADANVRRVMGLEAQGAQAREAAKQKRSALTSGLLGVAGAGAGAYLGGPAGASIGGGAGSMLGGLL